MAELEKEITKAFGNKLRIRVSGICIKENSILLIKHLSIGKKGILWAPPGGGVNFGESITDTLKREFLEETGLTVKVGNLVAVNEFLETPLHAIEIFFLVEIAEGKLALGIDPELAPTHQIISELCFVSFNEISKMDPEITHSMFKIYKSPEDFYKPVLFLQNIVK